jgi:hypothetical protein
MIPGWEVFLAYAIEVILIVWMVRTTIRYVSKSLRYRIKTEKLEVLKNPIKRLKDAPSFFNIKIIHEEQEEEPVKIPLRGEGVGSDNTAGLKESGVDTVMPLLITTEPKKTAEIVEGGKPNLESTPSKPSQLPASTTAQVLPTKSKKLRELEARRSKQ